MKKIMIVFLTCTIVLSACGSKSGLGNTDNTQKDTIMTEENETSDFSTKDTDTEEISTKEDKDNLIQKSEATTIADKDAETMSPEDDSENLIHNSEKNEDVNSVLEEKHESHESETVSSEKIENSNTNATLSAIIQSDITKITVTNGSTGEKKDINDMEEVDILLTQIRNLNIISQKKENVQGYSYSLALYKSESLVQIIYVNSGNIGVDRTVYSTESSQNIIDSIK